MKRLRVRRVDAVIPTASMADIAFLLIIFFMLTTSFSPVKMSVDLAEVEKLAAISALGPNGDIEISDRLQPGNKVNNLDELDIFIKEVLATDPTKQFIIKADKNIHYGAFNALYEKLRSNNCRRIALLTEAKPEAPR